MANIQFVTMAKVKKDAAWLDKSLELLKAHGVIKNFKDVVIGTNFKYPNVSAYKDGSGLEPRGFMAYFTKKYGAQIEELAKLPLPSKTQPKTQTERSVKIGEGRNINRVTAENVLLREMVEQLKQTIADKNEIISLLRERK